MLPAEFEPAIPASERQQILAFDLAATGVGRLHMYRCYKFKPHKQSVTLLSHVIYASA